MGGGAAGLQSRMVVMSDCLSASSSCLRRSRMRLRVISDVVSDVVSPRFD